MYLLNAFTNTVPWWKFCDRKKLLVNKSETEVGSIFVNAELTVFNNETFSSMWMSSSDQNFTNQNVFFSLSLCFKGFGKFASVYRVLLGNPSTNSSKVVKNVFKSKNVKKNLVYFCRIWADMLMPSAVHNFINQNCAFFVLKILVHSVCFEKT